MPIPEQRDLDKARGVIRDWLAGKLPDARDLAISPLIGPAFTGFSNETLLFDASWNEDGEARSAGFVIRVKPTSHTIFLEADFDSQYKVIKALSRAHRRAAPARALVRGRRVRPRRAVLRDGQGRGQRPVGQPAVHADGVAPRRGDAGGAGAGRLERPRSAVADPPDGLAQARLRLPRQAAIRRARHRPADRVLRAVVRVGGARPAPADRGGGAGLGEGQQADRRASTSRWRGATPASTTRCSTAPATSWPSSTGRWSRWPTR